MAPWRVPVFWRGPGIAFVGRLGHAQKGWPRDVTPLHGGAAQRVPVDCLR
jgi:hypothetical protein